MKKRRWTGLLPLLLLAGLVQAPLLLADERMATEGDLSRVRRKVEALRVWQLTEELNLDDETSSQLFPAMRQADEERWELEASNRGLVREMSRLLERDEPDSQRIERILDELQANRLELADVEQRHLERVRQILSPSDTARYLMFQIRFQREIRQKAAQALGDRRHSGDDMVPGSRERDKDMGSGGGGSGGGNGGGSSGGGGSGSGGRR